MDKNHDCISRVRNELKEANPEMGWVRFDCSTIKDMKSKNGIEMTGQRIEYSYKHKKKDGTEIEKIGKDFVTHDYCPFCGEKYK